MMTAASITLNNRELTRFFFAIVLLLVFSHGFGYLFHYFRMPKVVGEILGGLMLGPTVLGHFFPEAYTWIFDAFESEGKLISIVYWIGLVFLMFVSGTELQTSTSKEDRKIITSIILGATIVPFVAGWLAPHFYDFGAYLGPKNNSMALTIVIAIAVAVTSIPVISKIFLDLGIIQSRFAKIVLAAATIQDVILWIALAIATGLVSSEVTSTWGIISSVLITLAFFMATLLFMPGVLRYSNHLRINLLLKSSPTGYALFICFLFSAVASILDVNIVFGAFLAGIVLGSSDEERYVPVKQHIKEISLGFFTPIYFAVVGLKLDLIHALDIKFLLGFLLFTTLFESIGTIAFAKLIRLDWLSSLNLGVAMNTRGGPGIVLATVAYDLGIISETFFTTLVLIAIITSLLAGFWFKLALTKGWPLLR